MALTVDKTPSGREYKVKDISQADSGRLQIELAEVEMPGLMACRAEFGPSQPLKGAKITVVLNVTVQTAVLIETLTALGAEVRWCSAHMCSTQDHAAAAVARDSASVFAWKVDTWQEKLLCMERALDWGPGGGPDLIIDDGNKAVLFIKIGAMVEDESEKSGMVPDPTSVDEWTRIMLTIIRDGLDDDPKKYNRIKKGLVGVSETTANDDQRLCSSKVHDHMLFTAMDLNESFTNNKFVHLYGCRHSLPDGLMNATDIMITGKLCVVCGYGDVGKGCAAALKESGARVVVTEIDPICALQALMEGFQVVTLDDVVSDADIFVNTIDNKGVITVEHMRKMKDNAIVCSMSQFGGAIDSSGLLSFPGVTRTSIKTKTVRYVFPDTKSGIILLEYGAPMKYGLVTRNPNFVMSCAFTNQVVALLEMWKERFTGKYEKKIYMLPKHLDEKVAALHLPKLGAELTMLSKDQADYIHVSVEGPYKPANYKY